MDNYQQQALDFLSKHNLEFRAVLVGDDCPPFCEDAIKEIDMDKVNVFPRRTHIHGKHYRCTISGKERGHISFDFWNSYADEEENFFAFDGKHDSLDNWVTGRENVYWDKYRVGKYPSRARATKRIIPTAYDLLAGIQKYEVESFENFCSDFGYDNDSIRALEIYGAVRREYNKVRRFFTPEELTELQEIS